MQCLGVFGLIVLHMVAQLSTNGDKAFGGELNKLWDNLYEYV